MTDIIYRHCEHCIQRLAPGETACTDIHELPCDYPGCDGYLPVEVEKP